MSSSEVLDEVWHSYLGSIDCFKIASRCVSDADANYLKYTDFLSEKTDSAASWIMEARKNADDFVVLSLWAIFERLLVEEVQKESRKMLSGNELLLFTSKVHSKIEKEVEYWRADDVLDLFKGRVDADLIGNVKQVKRYRDWVAHRNQKKSKPKDVTPEIAYKILSAVAKEITFSQCGSD